MKFTAKAVLHWEFETESRAHADKLLDRELSMIEAGSGDEYQGYSATEMEEAAECGPTGKAQAS